MENVERSSEENFAIFEEWIKNFSESGEVRDIDPFLVRGVLEGVGANFEISEEAKESLGKYSNKGKRQGLDAVWGKDRVDGFKKWVINEYVPYIEEKVGRQLHTLWDPKTETFDTVKHSGMMQFFGELTAFAGGIMSFDNYKRLSEDRIKKGKKWQYGDPLEPYRPSKHASFPEDFPSKAIDRLRAEF